MGSIGPAEILVVLVVALLVLGPARLPEAARTVGKAMSELRRATSGLQTEVRDAFSDAPPVYPTPRTDDPAPSPADAAPADVAPADVAPADVAPADVAPADVAPADVAPADVAPADVAPAAPREG